MRRISVVVASVCVLMSGAAIAQDLEPNNSETPRFSGLYLGAGAGYGDYSSGGEGGFADFFAGFRQQTDSGLVYGVEGSIAVLDSDAVDTGTFDLFDSSASIMAKIGYTPDNRLMWYGGVGYTSIDVANEINTLGSADGVMFEGGLEYMATSWFGLRLRGQYHAASNEADITSIGAGLIFSF